MALVFVCLFERLGDEYFSWWYVQQMLPSMALVMVLLLAFMHLYSIFNLLFFLEFRNHLHQVEDYVSFGGAQQQQQQQQKTKQTKNKTRNSLSHLHTHN